MSFRNLLLCFLTILYFAPSANAQERPDFLNYLHHPWVDSLMNRLSTEDKIGQLFIVQAYSKEQKIASEVLNEVKNNKVGGVIFMQGTLANQSNAINELQKASSTPLLICTDGEWGPAMRLSDYPKYPYQMTMGAMRNDSLLYKMGREIGEQYRRMGVHVNFAPVSDVNNNPDNPVINYRSFGEDPMRVAQKVWQYAQGMQEEKVLAVAKHFPGHGDTNVDSHFGPPVINHSKEHLDTIEIKPFRELAYAGIGGMMTGHIQIPSLEPNPEIPASLSENIVQKLLKDEIGYEGMIFTDAMNMQGVTNLHNAGKAAVLAIKAGNDMLEIVPDIPLAIKAVKKAVDEGEISNDKIDYHCRRVLALKKWLELDQKHTVDMQNLAEDVLKPKYELTRRQLYEQSLTAVKNDLNIMPIAKLDTMKIACIAVGDKKDNSFQKMASRYISCANFSISKNASEQQIDDLIKKLDEYNLIIISIHGIRLTPSKNYGVTAAMLQVMQKTKDKQVIAVHFGNPYAMDKIEGLELAEGLIVAYQDNETTQELAAQGIFGSVSMSGRLPVKVNNYFLLNEGLEVQKINRLKYSIPEEVKVSSSFLENTIDSIAAAGISGRAYPGCQVLIAIDGKIILSKEYGTHTYKSNDKVLWDDVYDIASITKISSVTPILMKLIDEKRFNLDYPLSFYWPDFRGTDKEKISSRSLLAHQGQLAKWIPLVNLLAKENDNKLDKLYRNKESNHHNLEVAHNLYVHEESKETIYKIIRDSKLRSQAKYAYSDLGFIIYPEIISDLTGSGFDSYLDSCFFSPLGASSICYNAHKRFPLSKVVPTEDDKFFRKQLIQGYVHDEAAALLGGVSGNAGLFANANDLAKLMQMYLQYGNYGGVQFLDSTTIVEFTRRQFPDNDNRRALGFDKPLIENKVDDNYPCQYASEDSYGHTGFTGTMVWMDPKESILFVFLSNRVHPERNNKLSELNIRSAMLSSIYEAIDKGI